MNNGIAVLVLAFADYESLEISLAVHSKFFPLVVNGQRVRLFILQNGRGTYDCERTYRVAKRYSDLFPEDIVVIDDVKPGIPYFSIRSLLNDDRFKDVEFIAKLDDDVFPLTADWLTELYNTYSRKEQEIGEKLAYVTSLVNNNPYGFNKVLDIMDLRETYKSKYSRVHSVGIQGDHVHSPYRLAQKGEVGDGGFGTIWRLPYLARWIHQETTLCPDKFIAATRGLPTTEINSKNRYSINCVFMRKKLWNDINNGDDYDDELMLQKYCIKNDKKIFANLAVPMCHLFFYTQRFENKDLISLIVERYSQWLDLPFPIALCSDKKLENENRLRFLEKLISDGAVKGKPLKLKFMKAKDWIKGVLPKNSFLYDGCRGGYVVMKKAYKTTICIFNPHNR